jgi:8-oxo-dGTP diphosphatase
VKSDVIIVSAAVIEEGGRFLVTGRLSGTHLEGYWEFPGGKCLPGEPPRACLAREIREELDAEIVVGEELLETTYRYPDKTVTLKFFRATLSTAPRAALGQPMRWVRREELAELQFPPADKALIELLVRAAER